MKSEQCNLAPIVERGNEMTESKGVEMDLSKNRIRQIARTYTGNPKIRNLYTDADDKPVPPEWLIIVALNPDYEDLTICETFPLLQKLDIEASVSVTHGSAREPFHGRQDCNRVYLSRIHPSISLWMLFSPL